MRAILVLTLMLVASQVAAQHKHAGGAHRSVTPMETGQSAFAALAEVVAILEADPETDWETVNISELRRHLVDMELVILEAEVLATPRPEGVRFEIRGPQRVQEAIRAMVPPHARYLAAETGWSVLTSEIEDGVVLIVDGELAKIRGLGFFGLMSIGAHHQEHHLLMATGGRAHN